MSPADRAYLDMKYDPLSPYGLSWAGYIPTRSAHGWDPDHYLSDVEPSAVLGIEAPLWTETVRTLEEAQRLLMPRLAVLAEVGWSQPGEWGDLRQRLAGQAALWTELGIAFHPDPEVPWARDLGE
jgi:hexosaminidase